jgi:hypothetical protein
MVELTAVVLRPGATPLPDAPELPRVRAGSHFDAKQLRARIQGVLAGVERAGDVLAALLEQAQARAIHLVLECPGGGYFRDFTEFATCPAPHGLGMAPALLEVLAREHADPRRRARLVLEGPQLLLSRAAPRKGRRGVRGIEYSLQRLKRDRPDLLAKVAAGELTIQAAAEQAGHRPPFSAVLVEPMSIARLVVSRLDDAQQRELLDLVRHPEKIVDPAHGKNPHWERYRARQERRSPER